MDCRRFRIFVATVLLSLILPASCSNIHENREVLVSAAISLKDAFNEIGVAYERHTGIEVKLNLGSSGGLQKQIEAGAPVDVYASAGTKQMDALQAGGLIDNGTRRNFARNALVLVVPSGSGLGIDSLDDLARPEIYRLAIGNPKTVPAGQYAEQTLKTLGLWETLQARLVLAENVRQVLDYVVREEVDAGMVYASDVSISHGKAVAAASAPENSHAPILYPIAVVKDAASPEEALGFIEFVLGGYGQQILGQYGFLPLR